MDAAERLPLPPLAPGVLRTIHPLWIQQVLIYAALFVVACVLMALDDRTFLGVSVWLKPAKFSASLMVYFMTLAWCAAFAELRFLESLPGRMLAWAAVAMAAGEIVYIFIMAGLAQPSHFNYSSSWTSLAYSLMGVGATILVGVSLVLGIVIGWQRRARLGDPLVLSVVLGLVLTFALGGGFGGYLGSQGGHFVGGTGTDAGGLPMFSWNRFGGDLRVAHFFGMHAMQVIPVFGVLFRNRSRGVLWLLTCTLAYAGFTAFTFVQAVSGEPLL
ncbi:MAG: hypothetical protein AAF648_10530 [Pseudomonadota bacterium]